MAPYSVSSALLLTRANRGPMALYKQNGVLFGMQMNRQLCFRLCTVNICSVSAVMDAQAFFLHPTHMAVNPIDLFPLNDVSDN